ncbi:cytochrome P450 [Roseateles sp. BYS180W]|uniref:Cytochrome P450 n=1 Tax=Roseateles rivi TaxID=3299028 RepID=A0ABW7FQQ6_9BURK
MSLSESSMGIATCPRPCPLKHRAHTRPLPRGLNKLARDWGGWRAVARPRVCRNLSIQPERQTRTLHGAIPQTTLHMTLATSKSPDGRPLKRAPLTQPCLGACARRDPLHAAQRSAAMGDLVFSRVFCKRVWDVHHPRWLRALVVGPAPSRLRWEHPVEAFLRTQGAAANAATAWQEQHQCLRDSISRQRLESLAPSICLATERALSRLLPGPASMDDWINQLVMEVLLDALFSGICDGDPRQAATAVQGISAQALFDLRQPFTWPQWTPWQRRQRQWLRVLDGLVRSGLQRRERMPHITRPSDILAWLMAWRDSQGQPLDTTALHKTCVGLLLAQQASITAALRGWAACMAKHPRAQAQAFAQVQSVLGNQTPTSAQLLGPLRVIDATLHEAMRLHPPVPALVTGQLNADIELGGQRLARGDWLRVTPWVLHHDARWWRQPDAFVPQRFLGEEGHPKPLRWAYLPFGLDSHIGPGQHLPMMVMRIVAAMVLQRLALSPVAEGADAAPEPKRSSALQADKPLILQLSRRQPQTQPNRKPRPGA